MKKYLTPPTRVTLTGILLLLATLPGFSQPSNTSIYISAKIIRSDNSPVSDGTVIILAQKDSAFVKGDVWSNGELRLSLRAATQYILKLSAVGYQPHFMDVTTGNAGNMTLAPILLKDNNALQEVTVISKKKEIEVTPDKISFNVANSGLVSGGTAAELLQKTPRIMVQSDGSISIVGKGAAMIYLNDIPVTADFLRNIPADDIEKVEIITNPSSRYDAAGRGIINIITKKNRRSISYITLDASATYGARWRSTAGLRFGSRKRNYNIEGSYRYYPSQLLYTDKYDRTLQAGSETLNFDQYVEKQKDFTGRHAYRLGIDYELNRRNFMGLQYAGNIFDGTENITNTNTVTSSNALSNFILNNRTRSDIRYNNNSFTFYFRNKPNNGREFSFVADRAMYDSRVNDAINETIVRLGGNEDFVKRNNATNDITLNTAKADYRFALPGAKTRIETGAKFSQALTQSRLRFDELNGNDWKQNEQRSNAYNYNEKISAAYISSQSQWGKLSLSAGVRGEYTDASGYSVILDKNVISNTYFNFFPNASISYKPGKDFSYALGYAKRISRPRYQDMDPFLTYIDSLSIYKGNPALQPEISHSIETGITYKDFASLQVAYTVSRNVINTLISQFNDTSRISVATMGNIDNSRALSITLNLPYQTRTWTTFNVINFTRNLFSSDINGYDFSLVRPLWYFYSYNQFKLPKQYQLEITGRYNTSGANGIFEFSPILAVSASLRKSFLNNRLTTTLSANDIFNTNINRAKASLDKLQFRYRGFEDNFHIRLALSYKFGLSLANKHTGQPGNNTETSRIKKAD